jgi:hypothetical protein
MHHVWQNADGPAACQAGKADWRRAAHLLTEYISLVIVDGFIARIFRNTAGPGSNIPVM